MVLIKRLFFFISFFILTFKNYSQEKISLKDSLIIMNVMSLQEKAWNNGDIDSFMDGIILKKDIIILTLILK